MTGIVKSFDNNRGYGFIKNEEIDIYSDKNNFSIKVPPNPSIKDKTIATTINIIMVSKILFKCKFLNIYSDINKIVTAPIPYTGVQKPFKIPLLNPFPIISPNAPSTIKPNIEYTKKQFK